MRGLEELGRVRLSRQFYLRDFLHSEISAFHGLPNLPDRPELVIAHGQRLCQDLLEPLQDTFGRLAIRSGYRSARLNAYGNANGLNCARNDHPLECHVWDRGEGEDAIAGASVAIPWFADRYAEGRDWRDLAWWLYDHIDFAEAWFFPKLCAFNIAWRPAPRRRIDSYIAPRGCLLLPGAAPLESLAERQSRYADFPPFRGIVVPV
ncbi:hypothetical protein [Mesobacterium pallidum]|uniref:hypothetical protein n=1 Tax=Mesobacterium pallidum TaxID=2872037 RepID=UPI001EE16A05|nr:hypothetical protein [Mesobacterium pallidum]